MKTSILIVDDHKITRDGLSALVEKQLDMKVVGEAENGREALKLTKKLAPDVVIMDISMPELNGIDATRQILDVSPSTKVIALSMYSDKRYVEGMLSAGVSGYLAKNCAFGDLVDAIRAAINNTAYLSPGIANIVMREYSRKLSVGEKGPLPESKLSPREREVLQMIAEGYSTEQIAAALFISVKTVSTHRRNIMEKLQINSVADMVKFAIREGLTSM
jgi:DNA-binding NarL/FixJ family response regulator